MRLTFQVVENTVFDHFSKHNFKDIYYGRDDRSQEIDFVIPSQKQAYQVCYLLNDSNIQREIKTLNMFDGSSSLVYMYDQRSEKGDLGNIKLIGLDQFLLEI